MAADGEVVVRATLPDVVVTETPEAILFAGDHGPICCLRKSLSRFTSEPELAPTAYEALLASLDDPLADRLLAGGEPDFATIAGLLPSLRGPAFVGDEGTLERVELDPWGALPGEWTPALPPPETLTGIGVLDGWLPAPCHRYETDAQIVEQIAFGTCGAQGELVVWRRLRGTTVAGQDEQLVHQANGQETRAEDFYAALLSLWEHWMAFRRDGVRLRLPEADTLDAAQAMLQLGVLTFRGLVPRYGVGWYDEPRAHSFPPATIFLSQALMAWGHVRRAGEVLSHYLSRYVKPDGTFDYYGPAVAEYGQVLALAVEYVRLTGKRAWFTRRLTLLRPIWQRLLALREDTKQQFASDDPHHGLIPGLPEADYHAQPEQWQTFYYSGDVWTCRGLREVGRLLSEEDEDGLVAEGAALLAEADAYQQDIRRSLQRTVQPEAGYVPPGPDQLQPIENLTANQHASYCNYRYFPEMMSADILPPATLDALLQWRRTHGGELLGMTRFEGHMDDWPALHVARALLERDEPDRYLMLMYAHWAHHAATGTLGSYEQASIRPGEDDLKHMIAGQVLPCQAMTPIMLRWGLVYEEREADTLWLCRAVPRRWLAPGERLAVRRVPTRFGKVGFTIKLKQDGTGQVALRLPTAPVAAQIKLRLRLPEGRVVAARLHDVPLLLEDDLLTVPQGVAGKVRLQVEWQAM